jgi:hypothetical protein
MADDRRDQKPDLVDAMRQAPLSEAEIDELRRSGRAEQGVQDTPEVRHARGGGPSEGMKAGESLEAHRQRMLEAERESGAVSRRAHGGDEQMGSHRGLNAREGAEASVARKESSDESEVARRRAAGKGESQAERTQVEEDFGERGLRMPEHFDSSKAPSILDPEAE